MADEETTMPIGGYLQLKVEQMNWSRHTGTAFTPRFNWEERVGKKTEGELTDSHCVDGKVKGEGQIRDFGSPPARETRWQ